MKQALSQKISIKRKEFKSLILGKEESSSSSYDDLPEQPK